VAFVVPALCLAAPRTAHAYRPFDGTDADVAAPGEFEIEMGPSYLATRARGPEIALPALVLNEGLYGGLELVMDARNVLAPVGGREGWRLDDADVLVKYVVRRGSLQGRWGPSVATELGPLLPSIGASDMTGTGAQANLIVSQRWDAMALHANLGAALTRNGGQAIVGSVIVEGPSAFRVRPVAELLMEEDYDPGTASTYSLLVGAIWQPSESLAIDAASRALLVEGLPAYEFRAGLTWAFPLFAPDARSGGDPAPPHAVAWSRR
jgi:hypothetical protein